MSKNNVSGALDDWGFDAPKATIQTETKKVDTKVRKSESNNAIKSENKFTNKTGSKILVDKSDHLKANKLDIQIIRKPKSQEVRAKKIEYDLEQVKAIIEKVILKSKTFDLPPKLIRKIKMEAAFTDRKEYQIALEAFEQYFQEKF